MNGPMTRLAQASYPPSWVRHMPRGPRSSLVRASRPLAILHPGSRPRTHAAHASRSGCARSSPTLRVRVSHVPFIPQPVSTSHKARTPLLGTRGQQLACGSSRAVRPRVPQPILGPHDQLLTRSSCLEAKTSCPARASRLVPHAPRNVHA